jgi:hypothetical protein
MGDLLPWQRLLRIHHLGCFEDPELQKYEICQISGALWDVQRMARPLCVIGHGPRWWTYCSRLLPALHLLGLQRPFS